MQSRSRQRRPEDFERSSKLPRLSTDPATLNSQNISSHSSRGSHHTKTHCEKVFIRRE